MPARSIGELALQSRSQESCQLIGTHFTVAEDLVQQARSDRLTAMNGYHGGPTVWVPYEMMATPNANHVESDFGECGDQLLARRPWQPRHLPDRDALHTDEVE